MPQSENNFTTKDTKARAERHSDQVWLTSDYRHSRLFVFVRFGSLVVSFSSL